MKKLLLLEINEVPHKVYDHFLETNTSCLLSRILNSSKKLTTLSTDKGELHPWSTWSTLHRGIDNTVHQIKDIGQDLTTVNLQYPPIWEILIQNNISCGVFSSLHTYPLPENVRDYDYFVPDPFANGTDTYPKSLQVFQAFNLSMVKKSGRSVDKGIDKKAALRLAASFPALGLRFSTTLATINQLFQERREPWKASRRRSFQSILAFDLFLKLIKKEEASF